MRLSGDSELTIVRRNVGLLDAHEFLIIQVQNWMTT